MIQKPCTVPGCSALIAIGHNSRCQYHQVRHWREQKHDRKKFYNSAQWKRTRKQVLRFNPFCAECKREGKLIVANEVDHIKPITQGGEMLDHANLQGLCKQCHSRKTAREVLNG